MRLVTWRDFEFDGDRYYIRVCFYDEEHDYYTANWRRMSDGKSGELGYGLGQADDAILEAERLIVKQRKEEQNP